jgi:glycine cleavage system aminomethyltransferase T
LISSLRIGTGDFMLDLVELAEVLDGNVGAPGGTGRLSALSVAKTLPDSVNPDPGGGESVLCEGKAIARLTSAAYGYTLNHSLGFAYLPSRIEPSETALEVELYGNRVRARMLESAPYDAAGARLRG